ncbi:MAG: LamG-like jellyroll fold domain-containing protein [bacterium]|nr:LamG-like jellyroll fold domain-containing protein [bacterium]
MIKFKFPLCLVIIFILLLTSNSASAQSSLDTQALIKQLQAQIEALQKQVLNLNSRLETTQKEAVATKEEIKELKEEIKLTRTLRRGTKGDDVRELQEFLSQFPDIYPEGQVTGFFGARTEVAIKKLQEKYGIQAIGAVGPKTISKINELITEGAGKSGMIPPGLLRAPGIQKKLATTTESTLLYSTTTPIIATTTPSFYTATTTTVTSTTTITATPAQVAPAASPETQPVITTTTTTTATSTTTNTQTATTTMITTTTTTAPSTTATTTSVSFTVSSPNGGEQWTQGSTYNITWASAGSAPTARISLYESGSFKEILAAEVTNNGLWNWAIPSSLAAGTQYKIRVFNLAYPNNFDDSDNYFSVAGPVATAPDPNSLISHWKFDGNGNNEIAGRPAAVNVGNATTTTSGGKFGGYAYIPLSGDQVKIPYNSIYDMGDAFSVDFWFRQRSNQSVNQDLVYKGTPTNNYNFKIFRYLWNQYNNGAVIAGHTTVNTGYWTQTSNNNEPPHGSWHHVVYTKNSSAQAYYIDGVLIHSKDFTQYPEYGGAAKTPAVDIIVGGSAIDTDIDNLKIYNRALSASEVLYNFGSSQAGTKSTEKQLADMIAAVSRLAEEIKKLLK